MKNKIDRSSANDENFRNINEGQLYIKSIMKMAPHLCKEKMSQIRIFLNDEDSSIEAQEFNSVQ